MMPKISAVVCTHNRADLLPNAIESLLQQDLPARDFEVIIVDNASTDGTAEVVRGFAGRIRYVLEPELGLSAARNAGIRAATAEIIAFTDDDATASPDWLRRFVAHFEALDPRPAAIGGEMDPVWETDRPAWLTDAMLRPLSAHLGWSETAGYLPAEQWICEVNCAYRRDVLQAFGGFPTALGRRGNNLLSGENVLNEFMRRGGHVFYFDPAIRVRHFIPRSRISKTWFRRRYFWQGVTSAIVASEMQARGLEPEYWRLLTLPSSGQDWVQLFDEAGADSDFAEACSRLSQIGYLLSLKGMIDGR